ncbi:MAG: polysaccharide deacetylase family protein [Bacillota bacterium]|nr:polysaccharide deacetylase family protein [Bacillota bacterium]
MYEGGTREERYEQEKKEKRRKRRIIVLLILFCCVALATAGIALASYFATNVYQNDREFKEYASDQFKSQQVFKVKGQAEKSFEYGSPISYAVDYDTYDNETIKTFQQEKIAEIKTQFEQQKTEEEKQREVEAEKEGKYKPHQHALLINSAVYTSNNGVISVVVFYSDNEEKNKDMAKVSSSLETYNFSEETGRPIIPVQALEEDYREKCSLYFTEYFKTIYSDEELLNGWESYVTAEEANFNKFVMKENNVEFFFDEGTILKKSRGIVSAKIPNELLGETIRTSIIQRYIDPSKPMVALTYDDGPGGESEARILDCLDRNGAVATFFYYGSKISNDPSKLKQALDLGCEIGNHTWSHPKLTTLTPEQVTSEIAQTNEAIKAACGAYPTVFRPSYGLTNDSVNAISGLPVIMWSIDTLDWKTRDPQKTFESVAGSSSLDGKIVLMHSIHDPTADATELIVPWLQENGYQTVTVTELIKYRYGETPAAGKVYR